MDYQNEATVSVPALNTGDTPMTIRIRQSGVDRDDMGERARFAWVVLHNNVPCLDGNDLYGPATAGAEAMAVTLADFLGATWEHGELTEHGREYSASDRDWLSEHAERFGVWAAEYGS